MFISNWLDKIEEFFTRLVNRSTGREALRAIGLVALGLLALVPMWKASQVVLYAIGVMGVVLLAVHWTRKLLFPYIDLRVPYEEACKTPTGAAVVYVATLLFFALIGGGIVVMLK